MYLFPSTRVDYRQKETKLQIPLPLPTFVSNFYQLVPLISLSITIKIYFFVCVHYNQLPITVHFQVLQSSLEVISISITFTKTNNQLNYSCYTRSDCRFKNLKYTTSTSTTPKCR